MSTTIPDIQLAALNALYGMANTSLVRISASYHDSKLRVQIIMLETSDDDEVEDIRCFVIELVSRLYDAELESISLGSIARNQCR